MCFADLHDCLISASSFGFLEETELTYGSYFHASNFESILRFHVECTGLQGATLIGLFDVTIRYLNPDSIVDLSCIVGMMSQSNRHLYWFHCRCVWLPVVDPRPWWAFQDTLGVRDLKMNDISDERHWWSSFKTVQQSNAVQRVVSDGCLMVWQDTLLRSAMCKKEVFLK